VILTGNYRDGAVKIIMTVVLLIALFAWLEGGLSQGALIEAAPGLIIAGLGWLARKYPIPVARIIFLVTALFLYFILRKGFGAGQITTALIISIP
jgi:hypothetical protein